jgi:hypothetical protein
VRGPARFAWPDWIESEDIHAAGRKRMQGRTSHQPETDDRYLACPHGATPGELSSFRRGKLNAEATYLRVVPAIYTCPAPAMKSRLAGGLSRSRACHSRLANAAPLPREKLVDGPVSVALMGGGQVKRKRTLLRRYARRPIPAKPNIIIA